MSDQDVFDDKKKADDDNADKANAPAAPTNDPFADQLKGIVADDGRQKYKTTEEALAALGESQKFIAQLLKEKEEGNDQLQQTAAELSKMKTIDDFVSSLQKKPEDQEPKATPDGADDGVKKEDVQALLESTLAERDRSAQRGSNLKSVVESLSKTYGEKTGEYISKVAEDLGTTTAELKKLSEENPKLAMRLFNETGSRSSANPIKSTKMAPRTDSESNPAPHWDRGAGRGGLTDRQLAARWKEVGEFTKKRIGVEN